MHDILSELYLGNYRPFARSYAPDSLYVKASIRVSNLQDELSGRLPADLKEKFLEYSREYEALLDLEGQEDFSEGFRLGVRLMLSVMHPVSQ